MNGNDFLGWLMFLMLALFAITLVWSFFWAVGLA